MPAARSARASRKPPRQFLCALFIKGLFVKPFYFASPFPLLPEHCESYSQLVLRNARSATTF